MKSLKDNPLLFLILFVLFVLCRQHFFIISFVLCTSFWYLRTKDKSILFVIVVFALSCVPIYETSYPKMTQGTAVTVQNNYAVLADGMQRVMVYTDCPLELDAEYQIQGTYQKITGSKGFFKFDSLTWAHGMGAYYSIDGTSCTLLREHSTFRHFLQKKIASVNDEQTKQQLYHCLLNIKTEQKNENEDFLYVHGFSYAGMLFVWNLILKYFLDQRKRNRILLTVNVVLILIYHAPMLLVQTLVFRLLSRTKCNSAQKTALGFSIMMILYPSALLSFSFLIPACYRLSFLYRKDTKKKTFFVVMCLQSIFLHHINLIEMILYPINLIWIGILWMLGMISLLLPWIPFSGICTAVNQLNSLSGKLTIYGSMFGFGTVFYILLCLSFRKSRYKTIIYAGLMLLFQTTGMFHPLAEVTTINVGQGDSILIREPFNTQNVLIDTGKPSQWQALDDMLHSKGITKIDTLVITHSDNDHSGNMDKVIQNYHPDQVVASYQKVIRSRDLVLYDINEIQNDDENESSIVLAGRINGLNYLFMADADRTAEEKIADTYNRFQCDVLKLSHHGSDTGSCSRFLDTVQPQIGLISSGAYQIYHHPSPDTIQQLLKRHISYFDTKEAGDIMILSIARMNLLITADGKLGIIG